MSERTDTPATANSGRPPRTVTGLEPRICAWCEGLTRMGVLINIIEPSSGPGATQFACPECRSVHGLVSYADRPRTDAPAGRSS